MHPGCSSLFSAPHWPGHVKTGAQLLLSPPSLWLVGLAIWLTPHTQLQAKFVRACPDGACSLAEKTALRNLSGLAQRKQRCCGHSPQEALRACRLREGPWRVVGASQVTCGWQEGATEFQGLERWSGLEHGVRGPGGTGVQGSGRWSGSPAADPRPGAVGTSTIQRGGSQ